MKNRSLPIRTHLVEIRTRLTWSAIVVVMCTAIAFVFHQQLLEVLMAPARGFADVPNEKPIFTELTEFIGAAFKISILVGLFASLPFLIFQLVMFVAPGLTPYERRYLYVMLPVSLLAFATGAAFGDLVLFPPAIRFLLSFGSEVATPYIRIGNYVNVMVSLLFWMGLIFEMPVVAFFLAKIGILRAEFLAKQRRFAVVGAFFLGAIITPTFDPINQSLVAGPIIVLYEISIWLAKLGQRGRKETSVVLDVDSKDP